MQALSLFNVSVQLSTPRWVVGRALSLYQTFTFGGDGGRAAGLWGRLSDVTGPGVALMTAAADAADRARRWDCVWPVPEFSALTSTR